jgi:hypothetical protein
VESSEHVSHLDSWLIGRLRDTGRASRLGELLLDESSVAARIEALEDMVLALQARLDEEIGRVRPAVTGHVLFRPTHHGYDVVELDAPPPELGQPVIVDGRRYHVERVGRSPFPADRRPCLYLADD